MSGYERYPLVMTHPAQAAAVMGPIKRDGMGNIIESVTSTPARYQPVTVHNKDQEDYHRTLGYDTPGNPDPAAFEKAHASPYKPGETDEFPKMVDGVVVDPSKQSGVAQYPKALDKPDGTGQAFVNNEDEEVDLLAKWETQYGPQAAQAAQPEDEVTRLRRELAEAHAALAEAKKPGRKVKQAEEPVA